MVILQVRILPPLSPAQRIAFGLEVPILSVARDTYVFHLKKFRVLLHSLSSEQNQYTTQRVIAFLQAEVRRFGLLTPESLEELESGNDLAEIDWTAKCHT